MIEEVKKDSDPAARIPCSIALLTLNSEEHLSQCLESAKRFDVFILDGNSTDGTLAIAREFKIPVFKQVETEEKNVRIEDFTAMRMRGREMARHDWVFDLDSDEYISSALSAEVAEQLRVHEADKTIGFVIQNKHIIGGKLIEHSFSESFGLRLYNKKSGVTFKKGKLVHEKYEVPPHVKLITLKHCIYSYIADSYQDCIRKDNYYLSLMWKKSLAKYAGEDKSRRLLALKSIASNFIQAVKIIIESSFIYCRHGYAHSLPISQVVRHVRYHLFLSYFGLKHLYHYTFSSPHSKK